MTSLLGVAHFNFLTVNWIGQVAIIGAGVFLGRFAWGLIDAFAEAASRRGRQRALEQAIANGIAQAQAAADHDQVY